MTRGLHRDRAGAGPCPDSSVRCSSCGRTAPAVPLTWTLQVDDQGERRLCEQCTRRTVRSIEARLDGGAWG